jgi:membrane-associated phospholipid phosphatase
VQVRRYSLILMDAQVPTTNPSPYNTISPLDSTDKLLIAFWCLLSLISLFLHYRILLWWGIPAANIAAGVLVWAIARAAKRSDAPVMRIVHDWAAFPLVIFTYKQLYYLIRPIHQGRDYDPLLIALDRALFRINPTEWLTQFSTPPLTELLQIAYSLFYAIFLAIGLELYRRDHSRFRYFRFTIVYGFLLSYIGYFFLPSVGPRFTLHDFSKINTELPGLIVTPALRWFVNIFENIRSGMSNSVALASAQRDVFPSGHVMMTMLAIVLAYRYRLRVRRFMLVLGLLLIIATVYLRYHYVVDLLAGAILAVFCLLTSERVYAFFGETTENTNAKNSADSH